MFGCGAECPVELWRQITRTGLFTPKDKKLFSLTALLHFVPQRVAVGASAPTTAERARKSKQNKTQNPLDGKIKMLRIACSAARKLCFPFRLHKRVSFHAGVLMQLALLFPNVCQIVLRFQRVKETLSSFSFRGPGSNLATFLAGNLLSFLLFFPRIRT